MNKYKKEIEKICISDKVEEQLIAKCTKKRLNFSLATVCMVLIVFLSITIVHADAIKDSLSNLKIIRNLGHQEIRTDNKTIYLDEIHTLETKVDDIVFNLADADDISGSTVEYQYFQKTNIANSMKEIGDIHGVNLINFGNARYDYGYILNADGLVTSVNIGAKLDVECDGTCSVTNGKSGDKIILIHARFFTKNFTDEITDDLIVTYQHDTTRYYKEFSKFMDVDTNGVAVGNRLYSSDNNCIDISFNYDNVEYRITGWNMDYDEIEDYLMAI